jgi:hypothetical protein
MLKRKDKKKKEDSNNETRDEYYEDKARKRKILEIEVDDAPRRKGRSWLCAAS